MAGELCRIRWFTHLGGRQVHWISGHPPLSEPPCGFDDRKCRRTRRRYLRIGLSILCTVAASLLIGLFLLYRSRKFEKELERLLWKVEYQEIVLSVAHGTGIRRARYRNRWLLVNPSATSHTLRELGRLKKDVSCTLRLRGDAIEGPQATDVSDQSSPPSPFVNLLLNSPNRPGFFCSHRESQADLDKISQQLAINAANMAVFSSNAQRRRARRMLTLPSDETVTHLSGTDLVTFSNNVLGDVFSPHRHSVASGSLQVEELDSEKHVESAEHRNTSGSAFFGLPNKQERHPLLFTPTGLPPECTEARLGSGIRSWTTPSTVRGMYRKKLVAVHRLNIRLVHINREVKTSLKLLRDISHSNLCHFVGACVEQDHVCVLWDYTPRGSLRDIFQPDRPKLKPIFLTSLTLDLIRGLTFLHESDLQYHGNLKSTNCLIDSRWMLKLTDFGLTAFRVGESFAHLDDNAYFSRLIWTSPELLRRMLALLVSGQLCAFSHPQLALLTEQLVAQGITFTLNHSRRTTASESEAVENARNSESSTFLGTGANPVGHGTNNRNFQIQTGFTSKDKELITCGQKESDLTAVSSESRRYILSSRLARRKYLSQSDLHLQTDHKSTMETHEQRRFSQVNSYLPYIGRTESDSGLINVFNQNCHSELSALAEWKDRRTKRQPIKPSKNDCSASIVERRPKLSTILIHPEGASFVDQSVNHYRKQGDPCEQVSPGSHTDLHMLFHRRSKVHHKSPDQRHRRRRRVIHGIDWFYKQCNSHGCRRRPLGFIPRFSKNPSSPFRNSTSLLEPSMAPRKFFTHKQNAVQLPEVRDPIGSMQMADIYALGMVLFELYYQNDPYKHNRHRPKEIIRRVIVLNDEFKIPYRPNLSQLSREEKFVTDCIEACWAEKPLDRPTIKVRFLKVTPERPEPTASPKYQQESGKSPGQSIIQSIQQKLMSVHARHRSTTECDQRSGIS
ncbi:hypothetical protein T265_02719 [Opisthorchis viverrini]|uniref:guanylate cyclase n=1 Tax=Opisthorchis viverrini TaxID=6198 RepID=A0A074ZTU8_OPIVI|nr:hypothetical protein T265_02719 [Opisthorchis viverrini]KER30903.1 hypothetical protein T265_02719 [Opisthorchis viverrini]